MSPVSPVLRSVPTDRHSQVQATEMKSKRSVCGTSASKQQKAILTAHNAPVYSLTFSPDSRILISGEGYEHKTVRLWDVSSLQKKQTLRGASRKCL